LAHFLKDAEPKAAPVVKNAFALMAQRHKTLEPPKPRGVRNEKDKLENDVLEQHDLGFPIGNVQERWGQFKTPVVNAFW
jgi:hypothetical protein